MHTINGWEMTDTDKINARLDEIEDNSRRLVHSPHVCNSALAALRIALEGLASRRELLEELGATPRNWEHEIAAALEGKP
jgi:hypothetical protein